MKTTTLAAILLAATATTAYAASGETQKFVTAASSADLFEVQSSKLALERSSNAEVKKLARQLITDHTKSTSALKAALAKSDSDARPAATLEKKHADLLAGLKKTPADDFDADYLDAQEDTHEEAVSLFDGYAKKGDNAALKQFAGDTLPTLKKHKAHVETLDDKDIGDNL